MSPERSWTFGDAYPPIGRVAQGEADCSRRGFVNRTDAFQGQAAVMNGASDLLVQVFREIGTHTRTAVGVAGLPLGYAAFVYLIVEAE
jgi:enamine deaminase RidA (YjgF/YER057c/UK114 family)